MQTRIHKDACKKAVGMASSTIATNGGTNAMGASQVEMHITVYDASLCPYHSGIYDCSSVVANVYMSPAEARTQAGKLLMAAETAERLGERQPCPMKKPEVCPICGRPDSQAEIVGIAFCASSYHRSNLNG
jgi:hypothetical protein